MTHSDAQLALASNSGALAELEDLVDVATAYAENSTAEGTRKAYERDVRAFVAWCREHTRTSTPADPATVGLYLSYLAQRRRKVSTIERVLAALAGWQRGHGYEWPKGHPAIRSVMRGIRRSLGTAAAKKAPVMGDDLSRMVDTLDVDLAGLRDRAMITLGWFGAFRRSELVGLDVIDLRFVLEGAIVTLRRSKTDQEGRGAEKGIPYAGNAAVCPVRAMRAWLDAAALTEGPMFRGVDRHGNVGTDRMAGRSVARIIQRTAERAGIEADVGGHSLRAGFATTAAANGRSLDAIMRQTGHRSERVARGYVRHPVHGERCRRPSLAGSGAPARLHVSALRPARCSRSRRGAGGVGESPCQ